MLLRHPDIKSNLSLTTAEFIFDGRHVKLDGKEALLLTEETFYNSEYEALDVRGKTVIDLGANIGDTAIYFAMRGARKVIAIEPFEANFELLMENTEGMRNEITAVRAAVSKEGKAMRLPYKQGGLLIAEDTLGCRSVVGTTLKALLEAEKQPIAVKCDIEGAEAEVFLNATDETLQRADEYLIEWHEQARSGIERFERAGFKVKVHYRNRCSMIHAKRL